VRNRTESGVYKLDFQMSKLERDLMREFSDMLESKGFKYLYVPSIIRQDSFSRQGLDVDTLRIDTDTVLSGSAEQGILEYFTDSYVEPQLIYAQNTCFRQEDVYEGFKRLKEFNKLEQFCFTTENKWKEKFDLLLDNATTFLNRKGITNRVVNVTDRDGGYHKVKFDVEIYTKTYGWLESHSCSYFGTEQTDRFNITGATHTISNTGLASPRILIPFIESKEE
jgi:seryl-tRNA synthetase